MKHLLNSYNSFNTWYCRQHVICDSVIYYSPCFLRLPVSLDHVTPAHLLFRLGTSLTCLIHVPVRGEYRTKLRQWVDYKVVLLLPIDHMPRRSAVDTEFQVPTFTNRGVQSTTHSPSFSEHWQNLSRSFRHLLGLLRSEKRPCTTYYDARFKLMVRLRCFCLL